MSRRAIGAGLAAACVLVVWTFVVNGILGFQASIDMKQIPGERRVYDVLKEQIVRPGRYVCNPQLTPEGRFPDGKPVFSILHGGMGHESAGRLALVGLVLFLLAPMIGVWLLSHASEGVLSSYPRKVLFFVAIGLLFAIFADLRDYGIGGYPLKDATLLALNNLVVWTLMGLVVAWRLKP